ncbi:tyrosyl-DNA phosphodiesterase I [Podospora fimiseda]|uniref:Tyrosyl-DNA phosphodiesterase I n=1 Tax=Podospora fimiseda TaxID=252190 RepID=A0AAN6YNG7_9PEZI|nr:tyrosyl-DNA phosphodiesterase I [Podospora fimiseda]
MNSRKRADVDDGNGSSTPRSLTRLISPPRKKRRVSTTPEDSPALDQRSTTTNHVSTTTKTTTPPSSLPQVIKSPFQLTKIRDLPPELNKDTVALKDLLGDPLISECWEFNYIHDIDFLMSHFDQDVRQLVKVHVVHGFWKKEDPSRLQLQDDASRYPNVTLHAAYLPEMFGTHHTKMLILLCHDDTAQIIIHTANMIEKDWTNMTQAVWSSPRLPLLPRNKQTLQQPKIGNGAKFKIDFLNYLRSYDKNRPTCRDITNKLVHYDFSAIRGSLIGSVPGRHKPPSAPEEPTYGWLAIQQSLKNIPAKVSASSQIAIQISSIATLGPTNAWLKNTLFPALSTTRTTSSSNKSSSPTSPSFKVLFPTPSEIRRSLDGYVSGGSIHTKTSSSQQAKQLQYLQPLFHHWANDSSPESTKSGRQRAAPHIKTYIRYSSSDYTCIDWALLTSANLSKQAWGDTINQKTQEVRVCSYELGVLVWPGLYDEDENEAVMKPTFLTDEPGAPNQEAIVLLDDEDEVRPKAKGKGKEKEVVSDPRVVVGLRMPYNLPLQPYEEGEGPWVATASYMEPDWMGRIWSR